jgi:sulfate adenylyltransferase subunit 2
MPSSNIFSLDKPQVWSTDLAFQQLKSLGEAETKRTVERRLKEWKILPPELGVDVLHDEFGKPLVSSVRDFEIGEARDKRRLVLFAQLFPLPNGHPCLHANDARGGRYWIPFETPEVSTEQIALALGKLQKHADKPISLFPHAELVAKIRRMTPPPSVDFCLLGYFPVVDLKDQLLRPVPKTFAPSGKMSHLDHLEAESIFILREAVAGAENPVMLYSCGKDSTAMLHLARKAFFPAKPPFSLLHVDTLWKFREMYLFRDAIAHETGMNLIVYTNPDVIEKNINPFDHGSALHTDIAKTQALRQILDKEKFDVVFGGARRDEEKSRAKERIFSFRSESHRWDPKNQRPELWNNYNTLKQKGESLRVFPLSNWTELDVWQYTYRENIPVVPLYFAKERPVVVRDGLILTIDDDRMRFLPGERIERRKIRFRTLGCYPLSGAIESEAGTLPEIIEELIAARTSERQGRAIDTDSSGSMERKKKEGYF